MPERNPPPSVPVRTYPSPRLSDQVLIEWVNNELGDYTPLAAGSAHPNQREFSGFFLGAQRQNPTDHNFIQRIWVTDETSSDAFNYAIKFAGEDNSFPSFIRTYREPRATYTPRVKGTPLGTLYKTVMTNVGSGYANGAYPSVEFDIPTVEATSVAIGHGVVSADGSITEVVLDFGGEGYTQDVEFRVSPPINGDRATGIAYVQPQIAILVREEANLYPPDSEFYAQYLQVTRVYETIPGPTFNSTQFDEDGVIVNVATTRKLCSEVTFDTWENISDGVWCQTTGKSTDIDVICEEIVRCRTVPGLPMVTIKIDDDGFQRDIVKTLKDITTITADEFILAGVWTTVEQEDYPGSSVVAWEVVTAREVPGNNVPSATVTGDDEVSLAFRSLQDTTAITPSAMENAGIITTVEKKEVTDKVSHQIITQTPWLDKAFYSQRIPESVIPVEFRAAIPTVTESHILAGTASAAGATLSGSEIFVSEQQLTKLLYEHRTEDFGSIGFPIIQTNYETTEEYGGGILQVIRTLNNAVLTVDQGESVVRSEVHEIGQSYLWFKETASRFGAGAWGILPSRLWDDNLREEYDQTSQVVVSGTPEDPNPGGVFGWTSEVKALDIWRSQKVNVSKTVPIYVDAATALITYEFKPFKFPGLLTLATFGYYVRSAYAELVQHKLRTWWVNSVTTPVITVEDIIPDNIVISTLNDITALAYSGMVLHDDVTTFGTLFWPATTPSYTEYIALWQGFEHVVAATVTPEKEKDVWKITTESVVMR